MSAMRRTELPIPDFYDPANASKWEYSPDQQMLFERAGEWRKQHGVTASSSDRHKVHLVLVDVQKDFCFPEGSLFVGGRSGRGAVEDNDRIARFIYRNLGVITNITCTLDSHYPFQIFSPAFWIDETGHAPQANREVTLEDLREGRLRPNPAVADWLVGGDYEWLQRQVEFYCEQLERGGRYSLYLWPPHCIVGSEGHALVGVIHEARMFHSYVRVAPARIEIKGDTPLTEYYSAIEPEVRMSFDGKPLAQTNTDFLDILSDSDAVIIAGQAASHCVRSTTEDVLEHLGKVGAKKVYILEDCMSSVAVPDPNAPGCFIFDFTEQTEEAFRHFTDAGGHIVKSTTPIEEWPDFPL